MQGMLNDYRTCDACGARVPRSQVHKNRYAQYICRDCRSTGVKAVGAKSIRAFLTRMPTLVLWGLGAVLVLVLLAVLLLVASSLHSYSNGGLIEDLKDAVRALNSLAH
jgi:hypothetical protein